MPDSINLMGANEEPKKSFSVDVSEVDEDLNVPEDLGSEAGSEPFWKRADSRIWMYILGGSVLILLTVFFVLSRQTSLFRGFVNGLEQPLVLNNDVNGSFVSTASTNTASSLSSTNNSSSSTSGSDEILDLFDDEIGSAPVVDYNDDLEDGEQEFVTDDDVEGSILDDQLFDDFFDDEIGDDFTDDGFFEDGSSLDPNLSLSSNTNSTVVLSPIVQGDTGPGLLAAFLPSLMYGFVRKRK